MATIEIIDGITSKDIILDEETMMMRVSSGGIAIRTTVNRNGQLTILDGGVAGLRLRSRRWLSR